jgi:predicted Zn-dependent peptidase
MCSTWSRPPPGATIPLARPILGTVDSVNAATVEGLSHWRGQLYAADRLIVSCSGAVELDEVLDLARREFGSMPASRPAPWRRTPAGFVGGRKSQARKLEQAHLVFMLPAVSAREDDYFALRIFAEALGGGNVVAPVPGSPREAGPSLQHRRLCRHLCRRRGARDLCRLRGRRRGRDRQGLRRADRCFWPPGSRTPSWPAPRPS